MAKKKLSKQIKVFGEMTLNTDDFIYDLNVNQTLQLIKLLDKAQEDFGFTEQLAVYFLREMLKENGFKLEEFMVKVNNRKYKV
jgi:hypothetical protein